jgi:hypothetical protein
MKTVPYNLKPSPKQHQLAAIDNFAGGVQLSKPETGLATDEFRQLVNWYIDDQGYLTLRPGYRPAQGVDSSLSNPGISFFCTDVSPGNVIIATQNGSDVDVSYWTGSAWNVIHKFTSSNDVIQYMEYAVNEKKDVFFFDGTNVPRRWSYTSKTVTITGGTKGATTLYTCSDTSGMAIGMTVTISLPSTTEYNVAGQKITAIVDNTSFSTDLVSTGFTPQPCDDSENKTGGTKSTGVGLPTTYTVASTTGLSDGLVVTCSGDAETGYNVAQTIVSGSIVLNTSFQTELDSSAFATDPDSSGSFTWKRAGTVVYYPSTPLGLAVPIDGGTVNNLTYSSHASYAGGAKTKMTFSSAHGITVVGQKVYFVGVTGGPNLTTWNHEDGVAVTDIVSSTEVAFGINYSALNNFGTATELYTTHYHFTTDKKLTNSTGLKYNGKYYYKATYFYDDGTKYGESNGMSVPQEVEVSGLATNETMYVTFHKVNVFPAGVTKVRIYRSKVDQAQGPFYYVGESDGNQDFVDNVADGEEGHMLPVDDGTVPNLKEGVVTAGRIVGIDGDIEEKIVWSEPGYPDLFPALNFFYLQEKAVGLVVFNRTTYILSESAVYAVPNSDFASQSPVMVSKKGCVSARTVQNVTTGICWLSNDNAYWANFNSVAEDGDYAIPIGTPLQDEITSMNPTAWKTATGGFFNEKYYLTLPSWGASGAYSVWCWNMRPAQRMLKSGRWGGWTSMDWFASDIQGFEDILFTLDPIKQSDNKYYLYTHDASGASGTLKDYPRYASGDYTASATPVGCIIESGLSLLPIDVYETVLYRTTIITETTGGTFEITAKLNKNADASAEYTRVLTVSLGDGYAQGAATNWFTWMQVGSDPNGLWPEQAIGNGASPSSAAMEYNVRPSNTLDAADSIIALHGLCCRSVPGGHWLYDYSL